MFHSFLLTFTRGYKLWRWKVCQWCDQTFWRCEKNSTLASFSCKAPEKKAQGTRGIRWFIPSIHVFSTLDPWAMNEAQVIYRILDKHMKEIFHKYQNTWSHPSIGACSAKSWLFSDVSLCVPFCRFLLIEGHLVRLILDTQNTVTHQWTQH